MRNLTDAERAEIQAITDQTAKQFKTRKKADEVTKTDNQTFSGQANFSDTRPADKAEFDFDEHNKAAKAHFGLSDIKNILARHNVRDSIRQYILQRNSVIKANKEKAKQKQKQKENKFISHPNWY